MAVVIGNSKTLTVETWVESYEVIAKPGDLTRFVATIHPTGTATWS